VNLHIANPERPGRGKQDHQTPEVLLDAVRQQLSIEMFARDLAASPENTVSRAYFTEEDNALVQDWTTPAGQWNWCNPPFGFIKPWVQRAHEFRTRGNTIMLVPAAAGSNWWRDWVHKKAMVWFLNGRLTFVGQPSCYKKDCAILLYGPECHYTGYGVWSWRQEVITMPTIRNAQRAPVPDHALALTLHAPNPVTDQLVIKVDDPWGAT
jgi:phage N-6-adenine-methyltransferase